ncbi:MAG TPA: HYR domain-containing protein, partial [Pyrinomonadaceae bacterium]|nr:HYR domain-containing protein [Pyrinomonadaceae bacterium]
VAVAPSSTAEGGANLVYTFTRTGPTTSAVTANFSVGGSASFPADYSQSGAATFTPPTATVTFGIGNSTATVIVTPLTDCAVEGPETVVFTVQPGTGYGVGSPSTATGTITNTPDSTLPTITCNADVVADFDPAAGGAVVTYVAPVGSDNCPGATTSQIAGLPSGSTFPLGTTTNTFRVTDASGNTAECSFKVIVALTSIIGLDSVTITGASFIDSYNSAIGYPASKSSLANVLSNGTITMGNSGKVWGNVRSTQAGINMTGASQVTGNATAGTTVSLSGSASVGGTITNHAPAPAMTLPAVPACGPPYSPNSGISGTYSYNSGTGDLSLSGANIATLANGNYCFHNITMGNSAQLKVNGLVNIKMTGTLNLSGNTSFSNTTGIPGNLRVLSSLASGGNGVILGNGTNVTMVIYAPQTGVSISGSAPLFGTVAAKRITLGNSGAIHYDTQLKTIWPDLWVLIVGP